jgi:ribonuclease P protein component
VAKQFTLGKNERLKSRKAIELLFQEGHRFTIVPYKIFYLPSEIKGLQFGIGVSSRNYKKAVDRNKIKRLTKEAYRLQKNNLQERLKEKNTGLNIFFVFTGKEIPAYEFVYEKVTIILNKLLKIINEKNTPGS